MAHASKEEATIKTASVRVHTRKALNKKAAGERSLIAYILDLPKTGYYVLTKQEKESEAT
jgi:hypothetical protein